MLKKIQLKSGSNTPILCPSIVDIKVVDNDLTEVTFKENFQELLDLEKELIRLKLKSKKNDHEKFDIVEEFIGPELREFYAECKSLEEHCRKSRIQKHVTSYLFNIWKENIDRNKN